MEFGSQKFDPKLLVDKEISIITNSNIRYEGILVKIDESTQKLTLKSVKQLGTEGRNAEIGKPEVVPPTDQVFPYVEFSVKLIKNISCNEPINSEPEVDECITILQEEPT